MNFVHMPSNILYFGRVINCQNRFIPDAVRDRIISGSLQNNHDSIVNVISEDTDNDWSDDAQLQGFLRIINQLTAIYAAHPNNMFALVEAVLRLTGLATPATVIFSKLKKVSENVRFGEFIDAITDVQDDDDDDDDEQHSNKNVQQLMITHTNNNINYFHYFFTASNNCNDTCRQGIGIRGGIHRTL